MKYEEKLQLMQHQNETVEKNLQCTGFFNASSPGVGKTITALAVWNRRPDSKRLLVLATKSILQSAWGNDIEKFIPDATYAIALAGKKREAAFLSGADIVIMNHDGIKWLEKNSHLLDGFTDIVIDESTAFKNRTSARSKALRKLRNKFKYRTAMTGTPTPNGAVDIWHQMLVIDDGDTFGTQFFAFQSQVCTPSPVPGVPGAVKWTDKPDAQMFIADRMKSKSIRHKFDECIDIPPLTIQTMEIALPPSLMKQYSQFKNQAVLELDSGDIDAVSAGVLANKLLQFTSGKVYDANGDAHVVHTERANLVISLVEESRKAVVAFLWTHQRDQLIELAEKAGLSYGVIDGSVAVQKRTEVVDAFQAGKLDVIFAHPQSAGHGLTLTYGDTLIWSSPTFNLEHYEQMNARIYRNGQKQKTRIIQIAAKDTYEIDVYKKLEGKQSAMNSLLETLKNN